MFIGVIGDGSCSERVAAIAYEVGKRIALSGAKLVCGGMGGVMEAAAKGAKSAGGLTIGILPGESRYNANPYIDIPVVTGIGEARNMIVVKSSDAVIAVQGMFGTLSEIAFALKSGIPVIGLNTWELKKKELPESPIIVASSAEDAVQKALDCIDATRQKILR